MRNFAGSNGSQSDSETKIAPVSHFPKKKPDQIPRIERSNLSISTKLNKIRRKKEYKEIAESPLYPNGNSLKNYQIDGLNWLHSNWHSSRSCILADEMGLGKTIQAIAFLDLLQNSYNIGGPFLIVAPLSTIPNWRSEIASWSNLAALSIVGNEQSRKQAIKDHKSQPIILTTFECLHMEKRFFTSREFAVLIIDEAHRLKNPSTSTYAICAALHSDHVILLTGTPIQNSPIELWSLLHFIDSSQFENSESFLRDYGSISDSKAVQSLQTLISPYFLRRRKADLNLSLSAKEETIIEVELTQVQKTLYRSILDDNREILLRSLSKATLRLQNVVMELRKICNHPFLLKGMEDVCFAQYLFSSHLPQETKHTPELELKSMIFASGKLILLDKLLPKLKDGGHKVLIFSQMVKLLDILEDYLVASGYSYQRLDGGDSVERREQSIDDFTKGESFVFLLSTRAGGFGINLVTADTVVLYDSDWNPQNDIQAQARCHRIGQKHDVKVYRLITHNTYEEEMFDRASKKLALDNAILNKEDADDVDMMLRKGAYQVFQDGNEEIEKFCSENIDQILERRSKKAKGNEGFSKVEFESKDEKDLKGEDFWAKLLKANIQNGEEPKRPRVSYEGSLADEDSDSEDSDYVPKTDEKAKKVHSHMKSEQVSPEELAKIYTEADALISVMRQYGFFNLKQHISNFTQKNAADSAAILFAALRMIGDRRKFYLNYLIRVLRSGGLTYKDRVKLKYPPFNDYSFMNGLLKGKPEDFLIACRTYDMLFTATSFLVLGDVKVPPAGCMNCPAFWGFSDDYRLLCGLCEKGFDFAEEIGTQILANHKKELITPHWFEQRRDILIFETVCFIPPEFVPPSGRPMSLSGFMELKPSLFNTSIMTIAQKRNALLALYLFGFPLKYAKENVYMKLQSLSGLRQVNRSAFRDFIISVVKECNYDSGVNLPNSNEDASWIPRSAIFSIRNNICLLDQVRDIFIRKAEIGELPKWEVAPTNWTRKHDLILYKKTAALGFAYLFYPNEKIASENSQLTEDQIESILLNPCAELIRKYLNFLLSVEERIKRIAQIVKCAAKERKETSQKKTIDYQGEKMGFLCSMSMSEGKTIYTLHSIEVPQILCSSADPERTLAMVREYLAELAKFDKRIHPLPPDLKACELFALGG